MAVRPAPAGNFVHGTASARGVGTRGLAGPFSQNGCQFFEGSYLDI
jgi:hypothetical protein